MTTTSKVFPYRPATHIVVWVAEWVPRTKPAPPATETAPAVPHVATDPLGVGLITAAGDNDKDSVDSKSRAGDKGKDSDKEKQEMSQKEEEAKKSSSSGGDAPKRDDDGVAGDVVGRKKVWLPVVPTLDDLRVALCEAFPHISPDRQRLIKLNKFGGVPSLLAEGPTANTYSFWLCEGDEVHVEYCEDFTKESPLLKSLAAQSSDYSFGISNSAFSPASWTSTSSTSSSSSGFKYSPPKERGIRIRRAGQPKQSTSSTSETNGGDASSASASVSAAGGGKSEGGSDAKNKTEEAEQTKRKIEESG